uniref:Uncharacterized protein n=1 Tax=Salix viminalis TaxID=40686 RepID=A0A6N2NHC3_SALVM
MEVQNPTRSSISTQNKKFHITCPVPQRIETQVSSLPTETHCATALVTGYNGQILPVEDPIPGQFRSGPVRFSPGFEDVEEGKEIILMVIGVLERSFAGVLVMGPLD